MKKILPAYYVFLPFWIASKFIIGEFDFKAVIGNILFVQYFTGHGKSFNWYVSAMWIFYLIVPYLYISIKKAVFFRTATLLVLSLLFSIPFLSNYDYLIIMARIPLFVLGMIFSHFSFKVEFISRKILCLLFVCMFIGIVALVYIQNKFMLLAMNYGLGWYPLILIVPGVCLCISWISSFAENIKLISIPFNLLNFLGKYTFEIYLLHIFITEVVQGLDQNKIIDKGDVPIQIFCVVVLIPLTFLLYCGEKVVRNFIGKMRLKCTIGTNDAA